MVFYGRLLSFLAVKDPNSFVLVIHRSKFLQARHVGEKRGKVRFIKNVLETSRSNVFEGKQYYNDLVLQNILRDLKMPCFFLRLGRGVCYCFLSISRALAWTSKVD